MDRVGILAFPGMEELDAVGPYEIFAFWSLNWPGDGWDVRLFSADGGAVTCAKGLTVAAQASAADVGPLGVLVHPGGEGRRALQADARHLDWVRSVQAPLTTSVCTGALVYAAAGLLAGRAATTHHGAIDELAALDPSIDVRREVRYVDDGDLITSAGVSAGIDMALHVVARLVSATRAREVARGTEYDYGEYGGARPAGFTGG